MNSKRNNCHESCMIFFFIYIDIPFLRIDTVSPNKISLYSRVSIFSYFYFLIYFIQTEYTKLTHPQWAYSPSLLRYIVMQRSTDSSLAVETKGRKKADKKSMVDNLVPREPRSRASLMCCIANKDWLKLRNKGHARVSVH